MSMEPWMRELANVNRERQAEERSRLDERWDRLSSGDLSPEEEAELRALAETSEEAREADEAFRPLGPEFHARVVKKIREQGLVPVAPAEELPKPLPFPPRPARWVGWGSLAAVAAVLLVMFLRPPSLPPLPTYTATLEGGNQVFRGGEPEAGGAFVPGTLLTLYAEPDQAVTGPVEARGFAACGTGLVQLEKEPTVAGPSGNIRLEGEVGEDIPLPSGTCKILLVVCRPGKLPTVDELQGKLDDGRFQHAGCQATESQPFKVRDQA